MTDANINLLQYETCKHAQSFLHTLQNLCFIPTIDKPTRAHNASATHTDNIFVNKSDAHILSGNIVSDISDHFSQFCACSSLGGNIVLRTSPLVRPRAKGEVLGARLFRRENKATENCNTRLLKILRRKICQ